MLPDNSPTKTHQEGWPSLRSVNISIDEIVACKVTHTSIDIFPYRVSDVASVLDRGREFRELRAVSKVTLMVHGNLEGVFLPSKNIIAVLPVAGT